MPFIDADAAVRFATFDDSGVRSIDYATHVPGLGRSVGAEVRRDIRSRILAVLSQLEPWEREAYALRCHGVAYSKIALHVGMRKSTVCRKIDLVRAVVSARLVALGLIEGADCEAEERAPALRAWRAF